MSVLVPSLHGRVLRAFALIVVLAVVLAVGVGYYVTERQMDGFVAQLIAIEADSVARSLSRAYGSAGGWRSVERVLADAGYRYADEGEEHEGRGEREEHGGSETFHVERVRIVVVDGAGRTIHDNLSELRPGAPAPELGGERVAVTDGETGRRVGDVYVDVERAFLGTESHGLLRRILTTTALGGVLVAAVALAVAAWLSRRITAPVRRLTEAAGSIAQRGDSALLPVTSDDELGKMSTAFNRMTNALQTQRDLRRRLIDDLAHELNTPLSVIRLEAQGLRDGLQEPEQAAERIIEEVTMLRNLVRDLSWLAETDSGELRLSRESCSVSDLLGAEVRRWQPQARMRRIGLSLQMRPGLPDVELDRMRISQALGNVLHNALQHTGTGGRITVTADLEAGERVAIAVSDDGAGIDAADLPHLFDRLYRADQSRSRRTGGAGLGLAIVHAIVTAHAGTVEAHSAGLGQGTTVRLSLPAHWGSRAGRGGRAPRPRAASD